MPEFTVRPPADETEMDALAAVLRGCFLPTTESWDEYVECLGIDGFRVVLEGDRLAGMISERDVVHAFAAHRGEAAEIKTAEVMTHNVLTCRPEDSLTRVLGLMTRHRVRHLPVLEGGKLAGVISIGDAVKHRLDELELEASVLRDAYITGH